MSRINNILEPEPKEVLNANHRCNFELFDLDDTDYQGESNYIYGFCFLDVQGQEKYYISLEQDLDHFNQYIVYPPCESIGSTDFIYFEGLFVECWSLEQFCLASHSFCAVITDQFS